jgi:uncharacterized protein involved in exopolysaccharide biosynthesis
VSEQISTGGTFPSSITMKDILGIGFRHKQKMIVCFCAIVVGAILVSIIMPPTYKAHTKLLLKRERVDPVISPGQEAPVMMQNEISEEELNSEVELLESDDVLRQVVVNCGLQNRRPSIWQRLGLQKSDPQEDIAKATTQLRAELQVSAIAKTNLISLSYSSDDPKKAANVLKNIDEIYITSNAEVHRPHGQYKFFEQEAERYQSELKDAEQQLKQFAAESGGVAPQIARDNTLAKLSEFTGSLEQTRAEMAATEQKIQTLEKQSDQLPSRITTQLREADDASVLQGLKGTLMTLELKRTELLTKYQPTYPLVLEVEKEIADTRQSIDNESTKPVKEQTTDSNPSYQYVSTELLKAKADFSAEQARAAATQTIVAMYRQQAEELEQKGIIHQDLVRAQKASEDNFLLYQKKREEARLSDALDARRILNVVVVEQAFVPVLPASSPWAIIGFGLIIAMLASVGVALGADYLDPSLRTPSEVVNELNVALLAAVPYQRAGGANGNGNGNGNGDHYGHGNYDEGVAVGGTAEERL